MQRDVKLPDYKISKLQTRQRGYIMITLMLALALITVGLLAVLPAVKQQIKRDREDEMRHRGTAYMRAIQHFYKKFGRYPTKVEELENTNNVRFLRKRYTDPINRDPATGKEKDFKFLHQQDISLNNGPVLGQTPGQAGAAGASGFGGAQSSFGGSSSFGGTQSAFGGSGGFGGGSAFGGPSGGPGQSAGLGGQTSASSDSSGSSGGSSGGGSSSTSSSSENSGTGSSGSSDSNSNSSSSSSSANGQPNANGFNGPTFGGGPILGVASASKDKAIRVFFQKDHYNDWLFIYMPQADRGGLLVGPINPGMSTGNMGGLTPGQMAAGASGQGGLGQSGAGQSGFGQSGFGQSSFGQGQGQGSSNGGGFNQPPQQQSPQNPSPQQ